MVEYSKKAQVDIMAVLTKEQRGVWNGGILNEAMTGEFTGIDLSDEQTKKIAEMCKARGEAMTGPADPVSQAPVYTSLKGTILRTVLKPAQQKEYSKTHKPEPPPKAGGGAAL